MNFYDNIQVKNAEGYTWTTFVGDRAVATARCEPSHYTGDPGVAARICRYQILEEYKNSNAEFCMLPQQVEWATANGFKVIYWTNQVNSRLLLGKHASSYFNTPIYRSFELQENMLFKVSPHSDFLQYMYVKRLDKDFVWQPRTNVVHYSHHGRDYDLSLALKNAERIEYSQKADQSL